MLKKTLCFAAAIALGAALVGCSSVDPGTTLNNQKLTESDATPVAHINGYAWGIYLFNLPLFCGSTKAPGTCAVFSDTVKVDGAVSMITKKSGQLGATKVVDLQTDRSSTWIFPTVFFWYKEIEVSGNAVK